MESRRVVIHLRSGRLVEEVMSDLPGTEALPTDVTFEGLHWWTREWTEGFKAYVDKWMNDRNLTEAHLFGDIDERADGC